MRDRWESVALHSVTISGGGRPGTYGYSLPHIRLQAEERAAVKINQNAKEAAEKIAASELRMVEMRGEAERSAKVQRQLFEELALQRAATAAAHEAASELLTRLPRAEFSRLQREEGDAIESFGFDAAELLRIEERINERAIARTTTTLDSYASNAERADIEQAQELLALRRQSAAASEALESHEAELLRALLDGVISEIERREERVQQAANVITQGSGLQDELREATEAAEAAARREEEATRRADELQLKMVELRSQATAAELQLTLYRMSHPNPDPDPNPNPNPNPNRRWRRSCCANNSPR